MNNLFKLSKQIVDDGLIPGINIAVIEENKITSMVYGFQSINKDSILPTTQYDIASLTKLFVTTRIFQLVDENKLELTCPVQKYLPDFVNSSVTVEQLLLHTSGFKPSVTGRYEMNRDEIIQSVLDCDDLRIESFGVTEYSCINFIVLGFIIDAIDRPLHDSLEQFIFTPLLLTQTQYKPSDGLRCAPTELNKFNTYTQGIVHDETARNLGGISGNAGIFSTFNDLVTFTQSWLFDNRIASDATKQRVLNTNIHSRSYGWNRYTFNERSILFHTGFTGPLIMIDLECRRGLVIVTNRVHPTRVDRGFLEARNQLVEAFLQSDD